MLSLFIYFFKVHEPNTSCGDDVQLTFHNLHFTATFYCAVHVQGSFICDCQHCCVIGWVTVGVRVLTLYLISKRSCFSVTALPTGDQHI